MYTCRCVCTAVAQHAVYRGYVTGSRTTLWYAACGQCAMPRAHAYSYRTNPGLLVNSTKLLGGRIRRYKSPLRKTMALKRGGGVFAPGCTIL